jgi:hypothetical protein
MNDRLKSILKYFGVFLLGLIIGAFLIETLEVYLRPSYRDLVLRNHLKTEQEFLAMRATRNNKLLDATLHRWAVVNAAADEGFHQVFQPHSIDLDGAPYSYLYVMYVLKWMSSGENIKRGEKIAEGLDRGKLAAALESLGQKKAADNQWQRAQVLMHRKTMKETKEAIYSMLEHEKSDLYRKAEDTVLGPEQ